jgi:hypothetical protein
MDRLDIGVMDNDAAHFHEYAEECRRLAQRASERDKAVLTEIAAAWVVCAEEAEQTAVRN